MTEGRQAGVGEATLKGLRAAAHEARVMNWSPYTGAVVVAAVRTTQGQYVGGSNVEIANISLSKHAEESAVLVALAGGAMVDADGTTSVRCIEAVYTSAAPCGSCRQFLLEFATEECVVYIDDQPGDPEPTRFRDLLPRPFTPERQLAAGGRVQADHA